MGNLWTMIKFLTPVTAIIFTHSMLTSDTSPVELLERDNMQRPHVYRPRYWRTLMEYMCSGFCSFAHQRNPKPIPNSQNIVHPLNPPERKIEVREGISNVLKFHRSPVLVVEREGAPIGTRPQCGPSNEQSTWISCI